MSRGEHSTTEATSITGIEAVSFDVTGTLIHCPRLAEQYAQVLERHGVEAPVERLRELVPLVWRELSCRVVDGRDRFSEHPRGERGFWNDFLARLCAHLEVEHPGPFAAAELFDRFARGDAWEVYSDAVPTLERLVEGGLLVAVVSNWDSRLPSLLEDLGLVRYLAAVVSSSRIGFEKPHPAIFAALLAELDLRPEAVLHVGDRRLDDLEGALAVGMRSLLLDRSGRQGDLGGLDELPSRLFPVADVLS